jgi:uncharacterized protein YndB with AHSA1/START domain
MKREDYQPGSPGEASVQQDGAQWTLVLTREMPHAPSLVWSTLTDPGQLSQWAPFDADHSLSRPCEATLTMAGGTGTEKMQASVRRAEAPHLLEYTWGPGLLRWEVEPRPTGTRLTLRHTLDDRRWIPKVAAGWHICLDVAELLMAGERIGRIVAGDARHHGWERLNAAYAERLGIPDTGWPEQLRSEPQ